MKRIGLAAVLMALCLGCSHRYRVTDPGNGHVYYTKDIDKRDSGAREFKDAKTNAEVTLQSSVVEKISKEEFAAQVGQK